MLLLDIFSILQWWSLFFIIGFLFFPFTSKLFPSFVDKGYLFSKVIGICIVSYSIFLLGTLHLVPFSRNFAILITLFIGILLFITTISKDKKNLDKNNWKIIVLEEIIFLASLSFWAYIRSFQPDIYGLEKYMDFGFVNSILRSSYFPPKDMWFTPHTINYYYFGHFITAVLTKISGISSAITYNLMLATLFAFSFSLSFSLIFTLTSFVHKEIKKQVTQKNTLWIFLISLLTAALVSLGGNLHILYVFFTSYKTDNPVPFTQLTLALNTINSGNGYWYPNATRFIFNTIHEFPLYSFVVSDLHGHVLDIPIVLTIIALLLQLFFSRKITLLKLFFLSFFLSCAYMTNAWDGGIYLLLSCIVIAYIQIIFLFPKEKDIKSLIINLFYYCLIVIAGFFLFSLPFSLFFQTGAIVHGIGVLCAPEFLTKLQHIGPFLFEADHCQRSPLWQLFILYGFFYFFALSLIILLVRLKKILQTDIFILLLISMATLLILIPEFLYMKDIYPAHYRANTMFKLTYESFILLSLVSGYVIFRIIFHISSVKTMIEKLGILFFVIITIFLSSLVLFYPTFAINSYYENLTKIKGLDGTTYLQKIHPDDYDAIQWINTNIPDQPIILEAQGDSYTDYGRISTNTGLPTILGWTVHEWLWRGSYDIPSPRIVEIQTLYETTKKKTAHDILRKYNVSYIYIGDLEKTKYPKLSEKKFHSLGRIVFQKGETKIFKVY